jgi:hypothetical protein
VLCGGGKGFNLLSTMSTVVYDRHPVNEVCCTMRLSDPAGNVWWSAVRCTTGFAAAPMTLAAGMPPGGGHVNMQCSLPEAHPANGVSHVTTYDIP